VLRAGLIGFGALGTLVADACRDGREVELRAVLVRPGSSKQVPSGCRVTDSLDELLGAGLDVVVECASQDAVRELGREVLASGADLALVSTGALGDPRVLAGLTAAAEAAGSRIVLPAGAIAGLDGLVAHREAGLRRVVYTSEKPPRAWAGTPAEDAFDLMGLERRTVIFEGTAAQAARLYPRNANLAVTVALAGIGLERTSIVLAADPSLTEIVGRIEADGRLGRLLVESRGPAAVDNPRSSAITAYSIVAALRGRSSRVVLPA
jgi:aspartate dehydrogenase